MERFEAGATAQLSAMIRIFRVLDVFKDRLVHAMPKLMTEGNGHLLAEPTIEYGVDQSPGEELGKAIEILEGVNSPKYNAQIKEAIRLIANAKGWYDSIVLRDQV